MCASIVPNVYVIIQQTSHHTTPHRTAPRTEYSAREPTADRKQQQKHVSFCLFAYFLHIFLEKKTDINANL